VDGWQLRLSNATANSYDDDDDDFDDGNDDANPFPKFQENYCTIF